MKLALKQRFKTLLLCLPVVAVLIAVFAVTGKHGWIAFSAFIAAFYFIVRISAKQGFHIPRHR